MSRNWKQISKIASSMEDGDLLLSNPEFSLEELPAGARPFRFEAPVVGGEEVPSSKELRSFLWENRKNRKVTRDTATIWRQGNVYGLGAITLDRAFERLTNG